ncbi:MAG: toll/interleukin-1 receptor domain-containing protein [Rhodomicrobium sp.]
MTKKVFISYRRIDTAPAAGRLYDRFCRLLGPRNVFLDVDAIDAGENFEAKIRNEIGKATAILVLIGKSWMEPAPGGDRPRLFDEDDHVRAEVKTALQRKTLTMPLLVDGAPMPSPELLPEDIRGISMLNAPPLRFESFDADADRIARKVLDLEPGQLLWDKPPLSRRIWSAVAGGLIAAAALLAIALAHNAYLNRPISASIGEEQTTIFIAGVVIFGVILGLLYGSRRRQLL